MCNQLNKKFSINTTERRKCRAIFHHLHPHLAPKETKMAALGESDIETWKKKKSNLSVGYKNNGMPCFSSFLMMIFWPRELLHCLRSWLFFLIFIIYFFLGGKNIFDSFSLYLFSRLFDLFFCVIFFLLLHATHPPPFSVLFCF